MSTPPPVEYDLDAFDPDDLNQVAKLLTDMHGFLPLELRYQAAAAALDRVYDYLAEGEQA